MCGLKLFFGDKMQNLNKKMKKRSIILLMLFIVFGLVIIAALFNLQILGYDKYQEEVLDQLTVETNVNPSRGTIYDRNGEILASNKTVWVIYILPKNISEPELIATNLSKILNISYDSILEKAQKKGYKYQIIDNDLNEKEVKDVRRFIDEYNLTDQIQINASTKRYYPFTGLASHTLGFVNSDGVGIYGLEKTYNNVLEGVSGKYLTAQNAQSGDMPFNFEEYFENSDGYNIVTTIDLYIQYQLEAQLELAAIESGAQNRATGIVMNPKTGEIYAMATYPSFDLNNPYALDEISLKKLESYDKNSAEYKNEYLNLMFSMWNNKAITELYEPGSTFKLVTTSVALQEKVANLNSTFNCSGSLKIDGFYRAISCHKRTGHGALNFKEALQQSCNPSMMNLAFRVGREKFYEYFKKFGYTAKTGIDLPSEATGVYHSYADFSNVSLAVYSFGQTFKTTPIQQIRAISAVANGGKIVTPYLLKKIVDDNGETIYKNEPKILNEILNTDVCSSISAILKEGVDGNGGAKNAYVAGYDIAAKTGTSEKKDKFDSEGKTSYRVSSCVAYAPSDDAQIAVIMIVDEPSVGTAYGSVVVAPYISKFLELVLPYLGIEPEYDIDSENYEQISVPYIEGMPINQAKEALDKLGVKYEVVGDGEGVLTQVPSKNSLIYKKTGKIIIYTEEKRDSYVVVPNVVGKTAEEANAILVNYGFNIKIEGATNFSKGNGARVVSQFPLADASIEYGQTVTIKVMFLDEKE